MALSFIVNQSKNEDEQVEGPLGASIEVLTATHVTSGNGHRSIIHSVLSGDVITVHGQSTETVPVEVVGCINLECQRTTMSIKTLMAATGALSLNGVPSRNVSALLKNSGGTRTLLVLIVSGQAVRIRWHKILDPFSREVDRGINKRLKKHTSWIQGRRNTIL